jgi:hypothetical protein
MRWRLLLYLGSALTACCLWSTSAFSYEFTPRAYWPAPKGLNVVGFGYQNSKGDIVTDPSLQITSGESNFDTVQATYQHTTSLFDRTVNLQFNLPYTQGVAEGFVDGLFRSRHLSEMADARVRLSVNLRGAPSMDASGFQTLRANPRTIVGASILVQLPTGSYDSDKLINAGSNRWAVKPALGMIWPLRPTWLLEFEVGAWVFGDNDNFLETTKQQDAIFSGEIHLVKRVRPGFWASLDVNYYAGGRTTVDDIRRADRQQNSRIGATVVFPFKGRHAIRVGVSTGLSTKSGGDYDSLSLGYLYAW